MKKIYSLQILRAVAVILVVWFHSIIQYASLDPLQTSLCYLKNFGAVGVDIFFCLSGFIVSVVAKSAKSAIEFYVKRLFRILPIYWLVFIGSLFTGNLLHHRSLDPAETMVLNFLLLPCSKVIVAPAWSLVFEMYFYSVLAISLAFSKTRYIQSTIAFLTLTIIASVIIAPKQSVFHYYTNAMIIEFVAGIVIGIIWNRRPKLSRKAAFSLIAVGSVALVTTVFTGYGMIYDASSVISGGWSTMRVLLWGLPAAVIVTGCVYWTANPTSPLTRIIVYLGDASYTIYLFHFPLLKYPARLIEMIPFEIDADTSIILCTVITVAVCALIYSLVERPMIHFFGKKTAAWFPKEA